MLKEFYASHMCAAVPNHLIRPIVVSFDKVGSESGSDEANESISLTKADGCIVVAAGCVLASVYLEYRCHSDLLR